MFKPYLRTGCIYLALLFVSASLNAQIYKWTDDKGQVHYSEMAPTDQKTEVVAPPLPPSEDPAIAQERVDALIQNQNQEIEDFNNAKTLASDKASHDERCRRARQDLQIAVARPSQSYRQSRTVVVVETEQQREAEFFRLRNRIDEVCVPYVPPVPIPVAQPAAEPTVGLPTE